MRNATSSTLIETWPGSAAGASAKTTAAAGTTSNRRRNMAAPSGNGRGGGGLWSVVEAEQGRHHRCAVRRLLKPLVTDERSIVTTGDRVWFRPADPNEAGRFAATRVRAGSAGTASAPRADAGRGETDDS